MITYVRGLMKVFYSKWMERPSHLFSLKSNFHWKSNNIGLIIYYLTIYKLELLLKYNMIKPSSM